MFNYLQKKGTVFAILVLGFFINLSAQQPCDGQEEGLPDTQIPVTGISSANPEAYCIYFRFDSNVTGMPIGITMDLWHEYEGDLGIFVEACGEILNVLQRPGAEGNCDAGCSGLFTNCGSSNPIGTPEEPEIINFYDFGPEPDNGIASGGTFGLTLDDSCMVSTLAVNSFADLWSNCSPGLVEAEICFTDHAFQHQGYVSNLNFIFPNPYICGCMDPDAVNYNPAASVSSGGCIYECPDFGLEVPITTFDLCSGGDTITISASADLAESPDFEWTETGGTDFLKDDNAPESEVCIPPDYVGQLIYNLTVTDAYGCQEFETVIVNVQQGPNLQLLGETSVCANDSTWLYITGGPFETINWSTGATSDSIHVGAGTYTVTVTDDQSTCSSSASVSVTGISLPPPTISGPDTICYGTSATLIADSIYTSYLWSTAADTAFIIVDSVGTYTLTVTDDNGCTAINSFVLETFDSLSLMISGPDSFCAGDSITLSATAGYDAYIWSTGDTTASVLAYQAGVYSITATDMNACSVTAAFSLSENLLPSPVISAPSVLCQDSVAILSLSENYALYNWSTVETTSTITVDVLGLYGVTVTDSLGCSGTASYELMSPDPIIVEIVGDTLVCPGDTTILIATPGFATYNWSDGTNLNPLQTNLPGVYELTVTDTQGCGATASIELSNHPLQTPQIDGDAEICAGAISTLNAAVGFSNYQWSTGATGASITVDSTANYSLQANDSNGCLAVATFDVLVRDPLLPAISGDSLICADISGVLYAPAGFNTYTWSGGSNADNLEISMPGSYGLTVTDDLNCTGIAEIEVSEVMLHPVIEGNVFFCSGSNTTLSVADTFATYQWEGGPSENTYTVNAAGTYQLTVTNDLGCSASANVVVDTWELPTPSIEGDLSFCEGENTVLDGGGNYNTYQWNLADETGQTITANQSGDYALTVTDANGCQGSDTVSLTALPLPTPMIEGVLEFCPEGETILTTQSGYSSYSWSTGDLTEQITFNETGSVGLTVTDSNNCVGSTSVTTAHFPTQIPQINGDTQFCLGDTTILTISPAFSTYAWSGGQSSAGIETTITGIVNVTVTDANNCQTENSIELANYAPPVVAITGPAGICEGGSALLTVVDTFQTYLWEDGSTASNLSVSTPGTYQLTVTTTQGCSATTQTALTNWSIPAPEISGILSFCEGGNTILNGDGNYNSYQWSLAGETGQTITANQPGDYSLTVTDVNGCQGADTVNLTVLPLPIPVIEGDLTFCPEGNTVLNSQTEFMAYSWSNGEQTPVITIDQAETVGLTVTDTNNCVGSTTVTTSLYTTVTPEILGETSFCIGEQTELMISPSFTTYSWSNGEEEAAINVSVPGLISVTVTDSNNCQTSNSVNLDNYQPANLLIGGLNGFCTGESTSLSVVDTFSNYQWSNGGQEASLEVDIEGAYSLIATDNNGCLAYDTFTVEAYELPLPQISGILSFCSANSTTLEVMGGDFVNYNWSTGASDPSIQIATEGAVSVTVTDTNGCVNTTEALITEVTSLSPQLIAAAGICPGESTIVYLANDYDTYLWSDGSTADSLVVTTAGQYQLTVTNDQGCSGTGDITIAAYTNPTLDIIGTDYFCAGQSTTLIAVSNTSNYQWNTGGQTASIEVMEAGDYFLTVTNTEGCSSTSQLSVFEQALPVFTLEGDAIFCEDSISTLQVLPAYAMYSWSTGENTQSISVDSPGMVEVVVTDSLGCTNSSQLEISNVPNPIAVTGPDQELDCAISEVQLESASLGSDLRYLWSGPGINPFNQQETSPWVSEAGSYNLIVTDTIYGCMSSPAGLEVSDVSYTPQVELSVLNELDCNSTTVLINGANSDNGPQFIYQWYDANNQLIAGATDLTYQASVAQEYTLLITDTLTACWASASIVVETDEAYPFVDAGITQQLDCGQPIGSLTGTVVPNDDFINIEWSGPAGSTINPDDELVIQVDQAGWYYLQATDLNNGCTNLDSVLVTEDFVAPIVLTSGDVVLFCNNESALLSGLGSSAGSSFQYQWLLNGEVIPNAMNLQFVATEPGTYTLQVVNEANNCSASASLLLSIDPAAPQAIDVQYVPPICAGQSNGSIQVSNVSGGMPPYAYSLSDGPFVTNPYFGGLAAGNYSLVLEDANGCQLNTNLILADGNDLSVDLGEDQVVEWGEEADIYPFLSVDSAAISLLNWQTSANLACPDCLYQLDMLLDESTRFFLSVVDINGCVAEDDVTIYVEKDRNIYVPNVFSPNGDGTNDRFYIFTDQRSVKEIREMKIFNRWGVHVFENYNFQPNNPHEGWDGRLMGEVLNPDVFAWYAIVELIDGQVIKLKGDVTLVK